MPDPAARNAALIEWAHETARFARALEGIAQSFAVEVERVDAELAEVRDDLQAIARRQSSTDRVLQARTEHLA